MSDGYVCMFKYLMGDYDDLPRHKLLLSTIMKDQSGSTSCISMSELPYDSTSSLGPHIYRMSCIGWKGGNVIGKQFGKSWGRN